MGKHSLRSDRTIRFSSTRSSKVKDVNYLLELRNNVLQETWPKCTATS